MSKYAMKRNISEDGGLAIEINTKIKINGFNDNYYLFNEKATK
jgi:hypothetical protein